MVISPFISAPKPLVPIDSMSTPPVDSMSTKTPPPLIAHMHTPPVDSMSTEPKMKPQQRKSFRINRRAIATLFGVGLMGFGIIGTVYSKTMPTEPKMELQQMGGLDDLVGVATISGVVLLSINSLHGQFTHLNDKIDNKFNTLGNKFEQAIENQGNEFKQVIKNQGTELKEDIREIRNQNNNIYQLLVAQANQKEKP